MRKDVLETRINCFIRLFDGELSGFNLPSMFTPVENGVKGEYSFTNKDREQMESILNLYRIKHMWTDTNKLIMLF